MPPNPEIERLAKAQENMNVKLDKILDLVGSHDRTLYGSEDDRETGHVLRIKALEVSERERDRKTIKAAIGITSIAMASGGIGAKLEAIKAFFMGGQGP